MKEIALPVEANALYEEIYFFSFDVSCWIGSKWFRVCVCVCLNEGF